MKSMVDKKQGVEIISQKIIIENFAELKFDWGVCSNNSKNRNVFDATFNNIGSLIGPFHGFPLHGVFLLAILLFPFCDAVTIFSFGRA